MNSIEFGQIEPTDSNVYRVMELSVQDLTDNGTVEENARNAIGIDDAKEHDTQASRLEAKPEQYSGAFKNGTLVAILKIAGWNDADNEPYAASSIERIVNRVSRRIGRQVVQSGALGIQALTADHSVDRPVLLNELLGYGLRKAIFDKNSDSLVFPEARTIYAPHHTYDHAENALVNHHFEPTGRRADQVVIRSQSLQFQQELWIRHPRSIDDTEA